MHDTSTLYNTLLADSNHWVETRLSIGEIGRLITKSGDVITFGGTSILVGASGADAGYDESILVSAETSTSIFASDTPEVGCCVSAEIDVEMLMPSGDIPRQARIVPYARLTNGKEYSEWIQKGVYYIDTRSVSMDSDDLQWLTLHGYDAMLKAEMDYPSSTLSWPATDISVVEEIADAMDVGIDQRTYDIMTWAYEVQYPGTEYSCREVLGYIAGSYGGCFVMSDEGELLLIKLNGIPAETRYLVTPTSDHSAITFGGDRILV